MATGRLQMMDCEAEKAVSDCAIQDRISSISMSSSERCEPRRHTGPVVHYRFMVSLAVLVLLLWQYGLPICARPSQRPRQITGMADYILKYAPMVWLDEQEPYFPSDIYAQVKNTHPAVHYDAVPNPPSPLTLDNLHELNVFGHNGSAVFLTSNTDITNDPVWLDGVVPNSAGKTEKAISAAIIVNDHGQGWVDAFYMYFYAYNMGNTVLFQELGDHIGDWEHNMIRFQDGKPTAIWYSQHGNGEAFTFEAVEKMGNRPVTYSARGSHANYATRGTHDHTIPDLNLPIGPLQDYCSQGMIWDPTLSSYFYNYNGTTRTFADADGNSPVGAMYFKGRWGDQQYPMSDERQKDFFGFKKYVSGPTGPWNKQLNRTKVCPDNGILCIVRGSLTP